MEIRNSFVVITSFGQKEIFFKEITIFHQRLYTFNKIEESYVSVVVDDAAMLLRQTVTNFLHLVSVVLLLTVKSKVFFSWKGHDPSESRIVLSRISLSSCRRGNGKETAGREKKLYQVSSSMLQRKKKRKRLTGPSSNCFSQSLIATQNLYLLSRD